MLLLRCHFLLHLLLLLLLSPPLILSLHPEGLVLQQAKLALHDPTNALSTWKSTDNNSPCHWNGVVCDSGNNSITALDLSSFNLAGPFPSVLCNLKNLSFISFYDNFINSTLQENELSTCRALEHLNLAQNLLTGELPKTLADLPKLKHLDLTGNNFSGFIPESFAKFPKLENLSLVENLLQGVVPAFLGNVTSLKHLNLSYNQFSPGRIPPEFGNLTNLEVLWMTGTKLVGEIPESLGRLSRLTDLDLACNALTGPVPSSLTQLTNLVLLELYNNSLTGELPREGWSNMTSLRWVDASMNKLTGTIPSELCELPLASLNLYENKLRGGLPEGIVNSPNLYELKLFENKLSGELPSNLGKNSPLRWIDVSGNNFSGQIPINLCFHGALEELLLIDNSMSGEIPATLAGCRSLSRMRLANNRFSGEVPERFWGLPQLSLLELVGNSFSGRISKTIAGASNLEQLILSDNEFSGSLPEEIGAVYSLLELSVNDNKLSGPLPSSIVNLTQLVFFEVNGNRLSGRIPSGIRSWKKLTELNLADNDFSGEIPNEIGDLAVLNYLDLSANRFSGVIPFGLQNLKLNYLNFSNNHLSGDIPPLYAKGMYKDSFVGNPGLCGKIRGLCDAKTDNAGYVWLMRSIFVLAGLILIVGVSWFYLRYRMFKKSKMLIDKSKWKLMSFHKKDFSQDEIFNALDEDNVIGSGSSGKVYKVVLSNSEVVAVKKLWGRSKLADNWDMEAGTLQDDGFDAEVDTLGKIRHKNIVKLWCSCITKDCNLLVYEYMPNGSLGDLLHSTKGDLLDWPTRFRIAMDAAEGLSYLHHDCVPPIVHRDVKSNNILLDSDYGARVADFGVAKMFDANEKGIKSMSGITGSCGYIAPEYAYTLRVNEKSDTYSFGVIIFELITGKLPVDPEYGEKDLVKWVCATLNQKGIDNVIDPKLNSCYKDEICRVLNVGLLCTSPLPINRPSMRRVVKIFQEIGGATNQLNISNRDGRLTPYYYEDASDQGSVA